MRTTTLWLVAGSTLSNTFTYTYLSQHFGKCRTAVKPFGRTKIWGNKASLLQQSSNQYVCIRHTIRASYFKRKHSAALGSEVYQ